MIFLFGVCVGVFPQSKDMNIKLNVNSLYARTWDWMYSRASVCVSPLIDCRPDRAVLPSSPNACWDWIKDPWYWNILMDTENRWRDVYKKGKTSVVNSLIKWCIEALTLWADVLPQCSNWQTENSTGVMYNINKSKTLCATDDYILVLKIQHKA